MAKYWTSCRRTTNRKINLPVLSVVDSTFSKFQLPIFVCSLSLVFVQCKFNFSKRKKSGYIYSILCINKFITLVNHFVNTENVIGLYQFNESNI